MTCLPDRDPIEFERNDISVAHVSKRPASRTVYFRYVKWASRLLRTIDRPLDD